MIPPQPKRQVAICKLSKSGWPSATVHVLHGPGEAVASKLLECLQCKNILLFITAPLLLTLYFVLVHTKVK